MMQREENRNLFHCHFVHRKGYMIYYYYYYYYLLTQLVTAVEFLVSGSSPYTSTDKTNKNKYT